MWKTRKSLGFSKTEVSASKMCLESEGKLSFDPKENSEIFKDFFSKLATNLLSKLPLAPKKFGMDTVEAIEIILNLHHLLPSLKVRILLY